MTLTESLKPDKRITFATLAHGKRTMLFDGLKRAFGKDFDKHFKVVKYGDKVSRPHEIPFYIDEFESIPKEAIEKYKRKING